MSKTKLSVLASIVVLCSVSSFAVDGVVLINQASVMAAGGFPYQINSSGSYRLSGNLTVPSGVDGIDINADNVTLDLNGFTISGPVTCDGDFTTTTTTCTGSAGTGVLAFDQNNVTVRNGTIRGMGTGISHQGAGAVVEEVHAFNNRSAGIEVILSGVVRRNTANNNGGEGIFAQAGVITQNVANGNKSTGIVANTAVVSENTAWENGSDGIAAGDSKVTDNSSNFNRGFGLLIVDGLYGSNQFQGNTKGSVSAVGGVSQNNNNCAGSLC